MTEAHPTPAVVEERIFAFLCAKYVQRADERQKAIGLQYTTAETRDLARSLAAMLAAAPTPPVGIEAEERLRVYLEGLQGDDFLTPYEGMAKDLAAILSRIPVAAGGGEDMAFGDLPHALVGIAQHLDIERGADWKGRRETLLKAAGEMTRVSQALADPIAVRVNMLRGSLANPFADEITALQSDLDAARKRVRELEAKASDLVEAVEGLPGYGTLRNADGVRLKDHPSWVALYNARAPSQPVTEEAGEEEPDACPVCLAEFKADDLCATDIDLGTCHAACLEGAEVVDLDSGEPSDGPILTYRYDSLARPVTEGEGRG